MGVDHFSLIFIGIIFGSIATAIFMEKSMRKPEHKRNEAYARNLSEIIIELYGGGNHDLKDKILSQLTVKCEDNEEKIQEVMADSLYSYSRKKKISPGSVFGSEKRTISGLDLLIRSNNEHVMFDRRKYERLIEWDKTRFKYVNEASENSCLGLEHDVKKIIELRDTLQYGQY